MTSKKLIDLFKTGDFTIIYWDRNVASIYKGKWNFNKEFIKDEYEEMGKSLVVELDCDGYGYCPEIVEILSKALGGKTDSI